VNYGLVLFPGFAALDVFGPIDVLNLLAGFRPPMNLYILAATLDPVSNRLHNDTTLVFSGFAMPNGGGGGGGSGSGSNSPPPPPSSSPPYPLTRFAEHIVPTHTFADAARLPLDVLLVPGHSGGHIPAATHAPAAAFVAAAFPRLQYLLSVCSGARVLADAGVLAGRRATTNKFGWRQITTESAAARRVRWVPQARWVVDGNVWTASGISAGIDMALAFVRHLHGAPLAQWLADTMEYEWHKDAAWDPYAVLNNLTDAS
jgi:putative intracellular protease/amidase